MSRLATCSIEQHVIVPTTHSAFICLSSFLLPAFKKQLASTFAQTRQANAKKKKDLKG